MSQSNPTTSRAPSIRSSAGGRNNRLYGDRFRAAREDALRHCHGHCQLCGVKHDPPRFRLEAHHWAPAGQAPPTRQVSASDLTMLCRVCHGVAHSQRHAVDNGLDPVEAWRLMRLVFRAAVRAQRALRRAAAHG